jgi:hypothetical protein
MKFIQESRLAEARFTDERELALPPGSLPTASK